MDLKIKACVAIIIALNVGKTKKRKRWVKKWISMRDKYTHLNLINEMRLTDTDDYRNYFRMNEALFENLLQRISPHVTKQDTHMRNAITARDKLAVTLRYFATGRSFKDLSYTSILSPASISEAIIETSQALIFTLSDYIKIPSTHEKWKEIANDFGLLYDFWNCLGSLDGKHIKIICPPHSGALYYNYKGFYSIVLMALVNARKEFMMVDIGTNGRVSDGGVLFYTKFWEQYQKNNLNLPTPSMLPNTTTKYPYVFIADEAFALGQNLMKPYAQKNCNAEQLVFNMRLSRARQTVECCFGIMARRFRIFLAPIYLEPSKATIVTAACCYLHNFLLKENTKYYIPSNLENVNDNEITNVAPTLNRNATNEAKHIRDNLCKYFSKEGKI